MSAKLDTLQELLEALELQQITEDLILHRFEYKGTIYENKKVKNIIRHMEMRYWIQ